MILFADSSVLIWRFEGEIVFRRAARAAFDAVLSEHPDTRFAVSRLALLEVRVKPMRDNDTALLRRYDEFFAGSMEMVEVDAAVIDRATALRAAHGLKTADSIHAAPALSLKDAALFVTGDQVFERVIGLKVILVKP